jgi:hypothetical protein
MVNQHEGTAIRRHVMQPSRRRASVKTWLSVQWVERKWPYPKGHGVRTKSTAGADWDGGRRVQAAVFVFRAAGIVRSKIFRSNARDRRWM